MSASRVKNSIRNSIWGIVNRFVMMLGPFVFRAIIIRYIGAEYVGLSGLFRSILTMLNMTELGFGTSIVFMMYKPIAEGNQPEVRQLLNLMRIVYRYVGLAVLVLGCCFIPFLNIIVKNDTGATVNVYLLYGMYLFHTVASYWMFAYRASIFTANQRNDIVTKISLVTEITMYALQATILIVTRNYYLYLLVYSLIIIPQNMMYYFASRKLFPDLYCGDKPTKEQVSVLKSKIGSLMIHRVGGKIIISIDDIIISAFLGVSYLTQYDNYYFIASSLAGTFTILRSGIMASIGNKIFSDSMDNTYKAYKHVVFIWICIVGWCAACLAGLYQPFVRLWVGEKYVYNTFSMLSIVAYFFLWQFRFIGVTMKDAAGLWEPDKFKPIVGSILNFSMSIILVKYTGNVLGVLYPTMFVMLFIYFPWETVILFKNLFKRSSKDYLMLVGRCFITSVISITCTYFVGVLIGGTSVASFVIRTIACALSASTVLVLLNFRSNEFKGAMRMLQGVLIRR